MGIDISNGLIMGIDISGVLIMGIDISRWTNHGY